MTPALTYQGALRLLGQHDSKTLTVLDNLLGGVILAAGPAAFGGAQAAAFLWGAVDQKNQAVGLLRSLVTAGAARLSGATGRNRFELLQAAHTTIVGAALFEAWQARLGPVWAELEVTAEERIKLLTQRDGDDLVQLLARSEIPMPTGLASKLELRSYLLRAVLAGQAFFAGLAAGERNAWLGTEELAAAVVDDAFNRYQSLYLQLAVDVREFLIWAVLSGQDSLRDDLARQVGEQSAGLARLTALLTSPDPGPLPSGQMDLLRQANLAVLSRPPITADTLRYVEGLSFPSIEEGYVTPHYRRAKRRRNDNIADDNWWNEHAVNHDLDTFLAGHLMSPAAAGSPLLVLGDPGSGKSTLTKVLAARLPADRYLVVRVPLREVTADQRVRVQVQEALDNLLNDRAQWNVLADDSRDLIRVVIFDGLDELIQSVGLGRNYLREVQEFQETEAASGSPVCAIVTSRTLVTGRMWLPPDCRAIKLADFDDDQVGAWLNRWRTANAGTQGIRVPDTDSVRSLTDLSRQPLLLLLIALYAADPNSPELRGDTSAVDLYDRLIDNFIRREVDKDSRTAPADLADEIDRRRWQLGVAALAMFNRRRTFVLDSELEVDLDGLGAPVKSGGGQEVIGQFFFVHAASAKVPDYIKRRESYEFLHSTFGEYLVASAVLDEVRQIAVAAEPPTRRTRATPRLDDGVLHALLSFRALAAQPRALKFLRNLADALSEEGRTPVRGVLTRLLAQARRRTISVEYERYQPEELDPVRARAAYTANLVTLLSCLGEVPLALVVPDSADPVREWRALARLWQAVLDEDSWRGLTSSMTLRAQGRVIVALDDRPRRASSLEPGLLGMPARAEALALAEQLGGDRDTPWTGLLRRLLVGKLAEVDGRSPARFGDIRHALEFRGERELPGDLRQLLINLLGSTTVMWDYDDVRVFVSAVAAAGDFDRRIAWEPLVVPLSVFPQLLDDVPQLTTLFEHARLVRSSHFLFLRTLINDEMWLARVRGMIAGPLSPQRIESRVREITTGFDLPAQLARAVRGRGPGLRFLREYAIYRGRPLGRDDRANLNDVRPELRLHMPTGFRAAYASVGGRVDPARRGDRLLLPAELYVDDEMLVFRASTNGTAHWAVPFDDRSVHPVVMFRATGPTGGEWRPYMEEISTAFVEMAMSESLCGADRFAGHRRLDEETLAELERRYPRLPLPDYPRWSHPDGPPVRWFSGPQVVLRDEGRRHLRVQADTAEAFEAVKLALPGDWT
jgi:energy-coupling factor transporter ATP-binding protein EcfA2